MNQPITKTCEECGESFAALRPHARFCSEACRWQHWAKRHPRILTVEQTKPQTTETKDKTP